MLATISSATPWGVEARLVQVEVDIRNGIPLMQIVGLPDAAIRESRERVRSAILNSGFDLPSRVIIINLAPADLKKEGNHLDLAIAIGILAALGQAPQDRLEKRIFCGELGLDGSIRPVRGGLAIADLCGRENHRELLLPAPNAGEAAALGTVRVTPVSSLAQAVEHLHGHQPIPAALPNEHRPEHSRDPIDLADVRGQQGAKRALEVAAAGGHNLLFIGPPGSGKTMLARRLPGILPPLSKAESIAVTKIQSLVGEEPPSALVYQRPFRSPHSGISTAGLVGGGSIPRPGEASLAHCGVLFLDELPEFRRDALESLRQPLEDGKVRVVRTRARFEFPARFALLAAMNPCPCGHLGDPRLECRCSLAAIERYRGRISGPLLDRIDLHLEVPAVTLQELRSEPETEVSSAAVAERVQAARKRQHRRFGLVDTPTNAAMSSNLVREHCQLGAPASTLMETAYHRLKLSARAMTRILKVSRTIADLDGSTEIEPSHLGEAIQYRSLDRRTANADIA